MCSPAGAVLVRNIGVAMAAVGRRSAAVEAYKEARRLREHPRAVLGGAMLLVGGLKHPLACAAGGVLWTIGRYLYMVGYTEDSNKRYGKGGAIHWIGFLTALISSGKLAYDLVNAK